MRRRIYVAPSHTLTVAGPKIPLAEGISKPNIQVVTLAGQTFEIPMKGKLRNLQAMSDDELVAFTKAYCNEHKIVKRSQLEKSDNSLYLTLTKRDLVNQVFGQFKKREVLLVGGKTFSIPIDLKGNKNWLAMSDAILEDLVRAHKESGGSITDLRKKYGGLEVVVRGKGIVKKVYRVQIHREVVLGDNSFFIPLDITGKRNWDAMSDDKLVEFVNSYCEVNRISKKSILERKLSGAHHVLRKRKLIAQVFPYAEHEDIEIRGRVFRIPHDGKRSRSWKNMDLNELRDFAKLYCEVKGYTSGDLANKEPGLWVSLKNRGLLDQVFPRKYTEQVLDKEKFTIPLHKDGKRIAWDMVDDDLLIRFAKSYCIHNGITKKSELKRRNVAVYLELRRRNLVNVVFGYSKSIRIELAGETFVIPLDSKRSRNWKGMENDQVEKFAKAFCKHYNITKPSALERKDGTLYYELTRRDLLDRIFSEIRSAQKTSALSDIADALTKF
ncbi:MAG: hypothetical protein Q7S22_07090 [Candidatus Micrarchaeota archaeon]|nr:hypothetical protein [Candidatus Micrarchaeota archaeon]